MGAKQRPRDVYAPLPPATVRVLEALCVDGAPEKLIAQRLELAVGTVKFHMQNALTHSGLPPELRNRTALALWWIRAGRYEHAAATNSSR